MKARVLVVDDDVSVRESLQKVLEVAGYEVVMAGGGLEAAVRFEPEQIDMLLLDLNLPNQSGWEVLEHLTTRYPLVPVIIITGLPGQFSTALAAGADALFEKPIEVPPLLKTMERLLAEPKENRSVRLSGKAGRHSVPASRSERARGKPLPLGVGTSPAELIEPGPGQRQPEIASKPG
jgi:CheY-like chemotaxis protein